LTPTPPASCCEEIRGDVHGINRKSGQKSRKFSAQVQQDSALKRLGPVKKGVAGLNRSDRLSLHVMVLQLTQLTTSKVKRR